MIRKKISWFVGGFYFLISTVLFRDLALKPGIWDRGDTMFPVNDQGVAKWLSLSTSTWWNHEFLGFVTIVEGLPRMSYILMLKFFNLFFDNLSLVQFSWWVFIFTVMGLSMFILAKELFKNNYIAFFASFSYVFNPWVVDRTSHVLILQAYSFIPLFIFFFIRLLNKGELKYALYLTLPIFFIISSHHYTLISVMLAFLFLLARLASTQTFKERVKKLRILLFTLVIAILGLGFYSLPFLQSIFSGQSALNKALDFSSQNPGLYWGRFGFVTNVIRFLGFNDSAFNGHDYLGQFIVSFLVPILAFLPLIKRPVLTKGTVSKSDFYALYIIYLLGVALAASPHIFKEQVFSYISLLPTSIDPNYYVFFIVFSSSMLAGFGLWKVVNWLQKRKPSYGYIVYALTVVLLCYNVSILILWKSVSRYDKLTYPKEYVDAANILNKTPITDTRIFLLPEAAAIKHSWNSYPQINSDGYLFQKANFSRTAIELTSLSTTRFIRNLVLEEAENRKTISLLSLLRLASTEYVVLVNDIENEPKIKSYAETFAVQSNLLPVGGFYQNLKVYKLRKENILPHIYVAKDVINRATGNFKDIPKLLEKDLEGRPAIYFSSIKPTPVELEEEVGNTKESFSAIPSIKFVKLNPTKYKVQVKNAKEPYTLVFSESFHKYWKVYLKSSNDSDFRFNKETASYFDGEVKEGEHTDTIMQQNPFETFLKQPLAEDRHWLVNGYANSWRIEPKDVGNKEDYELIIEFWPQKLFYLGIIISILTITFFGLYMLIKRREPGDEISK